MDIITAKLGLIGAGNIKARIIVNSGITDNMNQLISKEVNELKQYVLDYYWEEIEGSISTVTLQKKVYTALKLYGIELSKDRICKLKSSNTLSEYKKAIAEMLHDDVINNGTSGISEIAYKAMRGLEVIDKINIGFNGGYVNFGKEKLEMYIGFVMRDYRFLSGSSNKTYIEDLENILAQYKIINGQVISEICSLYSITDRVKDCIEINIKDNGVYIQDSNSNILLINIDNRNNIVDTIIEKEYYKSRYEIVTNDI